MAASPVATSDAILDVTLVMDGSRPEPDTAPTTLPGGQAMRTGMAVAIVLAATSLAGAQHVHDGARGAEPHLVAGRCQPQFEQGSARGPGFGPGLAAHPGGDPRPLHALGL